MAALLLFLLGGALAFARPGDLDDGDDGEPAAAPAPQQQQQERQEQQPSVSTVQPAPPSTTPTTALGRQQPQARGQASSRERLAYTGPPTMASVPLALTLFVLGAAGTVITRRALPTDGVSIPRAGGTRAP